MLFWGQWWNFTFKTSIKLCSNLEKKQQILQKKTSQSFFWKRKMQISQQLWKHFDKSSNKQLKIWIKTFEKEGLNRKFFPSKVPLKVLKAVREQWYIFLVESPKFSLKFQNVYEILFFFSKSPQMLPTVTRSAVSTTMAKVGWKKANNFHVIIANFYDF